MAAELTPQSAMRICSLAIMVYDVIVTIPSELRLYKRQKSWKRPSISCCLFILIRYIGLFYAIWVTHTFFGRGFSLAECQRVTPVGALCRAILSSLSALIFIWRTYVIWQRNKIILIVMCLTLIPVTFFSYVSGLIQKAVISVAGGCTGVARGEGPLTLKWPFALSNLIFDTLAFSLSTFKLAKNVKGGQSRISTVLLTDGLIYFLIAVSAHAVNLSFLLSENSDTQGTFLTFQTTITTILGQRIITSLAERTTIIPASSHTESTRDRSGSRGRGLWAASTRPRPPVALVRTTRGATEIGGSAGAVEMMKIEVNTETHVRGDYESATNYKRTGEYE